MLLSFLWCLSHSVFQVNPIAVNSKYCNVFTENKREVSIISTAHFGKVQSSDLKGIEILEPSFANWSWIQWLFSWGHHRNSGTLILLLFSLNLKGMDVNFMSFFSLYSFHNSDWMIFTGRLLNLFLSFFVYVLGFSGEVEYLQFRYLMFFAFCNTEDAFCYAYFKLLSAVTLCQAVQE